MDAQKTITEVVDGVKSEGLFDQFRKECLEEFESMETYHQLKQRVENHVTSFLSKHKYNSGLHKNSLRSNLRNYISKSDVLLNGITQLVDEVLSLKGKSFCLRIDKHVDKHLTKQQQPDTATPPQQNGSDKTVQPNEPPVQNGLPSKAENNVQNEQKNEGQEHVVMDEQKSANSSETVTEFSEMEIEEVEMDLSENTDAQTPATNGDEGNKEKLKDTIDKEKKKKTKNKELNVNVKEEVDEVMASAIDTVSNISDETEIKEEPENMFKPITPPEQENEEDTKKEIKTEEDNVVLEEQEGDLNLPPIITEPITDDSNSNDSYADNVKVKMGQYRSSQGEVPVKIDDNECRRKSSRVRTLPLKFREEHGDDADSVSSNDIDYKDLEDGTYQMGKRGRQKKRPNSAGNPETSSGKTSRRQSVESTRRKKESSSLSKQEEAAINFLAKPEVRKTLTKERKSSKDDSEQGVRSSLDKEESDRHRSRRKSDSEKDERKSDKDDRKSDKEDRKSDKEGRKSEKDDRKSDKEGRKSDKEDRKSDKEDRKSGKEDRKSDKEDRKSDKEDRKSDKEDRKSDKEDRKSSKDKKSSSRDGGSSSGRDDDSKARRERKSGSVSDTSSNKDDRSRSKRDFKFESGDSCHSGGDDDDKTSRKREKNKEPRDSGSSSKESDDRKARERREQKSSGSSKDDERENRTKRDIKTESQPDKDDSDRKSKTKREEIKREESSESRDNRDTFRKRFHSPTPSLEEGQSKRSRRFIKQRQRYTPP